MAMIFTCTVCRTQARYESRNAAIAADWVFVTIETNARLKYWVLCREHATGLDWLKKALAEPTGRATPAEHREPKEPKEKK